MKKKLHIIKILAAVIVLFFISSSLYSQNVISSVSVQKSAEAVSKQLSKSSNDVEFVKLKSENWLTKKSYLDSYSSLENYKIKLAMYEKVVESDYDIENWMIDKNHWKTSGNNIETSDNDQKEIEPWMLDDNFWKIPEEEDIIQLEDWMTDTEFWVKVK